MEIRKSTFSDIPAVLELQNRYLFANLTAEERLDGFQTTPFSVSQIEEIIEKEGLFVAFDADILVGYAYAGDWDFFRQWPIFVYMVSIFPDLKYRGTAISEIPSFQYGPVCIEKTYRGRGILPLIFEKMRQTWAEKYPLGLTFINKINTRSFAAHTQKLGWEEIGSFGFNGNDYHFLAYDMQKVPRKRF